MTTRGHVLTMIFFLVFSLDAQTNPTIVSFSPARNSLIAVPETKIFVTFGSPMNSSTFTNNTIRINGSISGLHSSAFAYNTDTNAVSIIPTAPFKKGEIVTVMLTRGIKSAGGDSLTNSFCWSFTVKTDTSSGFFYQSSTVGVGNTPFFMAVADLDRDGSDDLAVVNYSGNNVSILKNDGNGLFTLSSTIAVGSYPGSIIAADLDGDGWMDLAVTNSASGTVSFLRNLGNGTFSRSDIQSNGNNPWNVAALDVDGDGDLDVAVANFSSNNVSILRNNGNGFFSYSSSLSVGVNPYSLAILDLEGDGVMDLAVANFSSNTISLLKNNGIGSFTQTSTVPVGDGPASILAVNIDSDNAIDLVVCNNKNSTVSILKNNGNGGFSQISTNSIGTNTAFAAATDIDGDGAMDIIVPGIGSITILKNNGAGVFTTKSVLTVGTGSIIRMVVAADLNNDGQIDFAGVDQSTNSMLIYKASPKSASLRLSSPALSFGSIASGSSRSKYLRIYNDGTDSSLVISSIVSSNLVFTVNPTSLVIPPSGSDSVQIIFSPTQSNLTFNDSLLLTSNDPKKPIVKISLTGSTLTTGIVNLVRSTPTTYTLSQNYPNPFNPSTTIHYALPISGKVTITVFNTLGQPIVTLVNEVQGAGYHEIQFNGDSLASGIYLYQITAGSFVQARKMLLIK